MKILVDIGEPTGFLMDVAEAKPVLKFAIPSKSPSLQGPPQTELDLFEIERVGTVVNGPNEGMPIYRLRDE